MGGNLSDKKFYSCPIAEIESGIAPELFKLYRRSQIEGVRILDLIDEPTEALLEGLETINNERTIINNEKLERQAKARKMAEQARRGSQK